MLDILKLGSYIFLYIALVDGVCDFLEWIFNIDLWPVALVTGCFLAACYILLTRDVCGFCNIKQNEAKMDAEAIVADADLESKH